MTTGTQMTTEQLERAGKWLWIGDTRLIAEVSVPHDSVEAQTWATLDSKLRYLAMEHLQDLSMEDFLKAFDPSQWTVDRMQQPNLPKDGEQDMTAGTDLVRLGNELQALRHEGEERVKRSRDGKGNLDHQIFEIRNPDIAEPMATWLTSQNDKASALQAQVKDCLEAGVTEDSFNELIATGWMPPQS